MWRADAIRRRGSMAPRTPCIAGNTLHRVVLPRIDALYLLSGRELRRMEHLSIDFLDSCHAKKHFLHWLRRYENCRGAIRQDVEALYHEYHAARVIRRFLHRIAQKHQSLVITGSFAAARYLESHRLEAWRPGDIDIFVFDKEVSTAVETEFIDTLKRQLCIDTARHGWTPEDGPCENAVGSLAFLDIDELSRTSRSHWTPRALRTSVSKWLESYSEAHRHEEEEEACEDVAVGEADTSSTTTRQEMQRVLSNLPEDPQPSTLRIWSTVRLTPIRRIPGMRNPRQKNMGMPAALLPINIIHVELIQDCAQEVDEADIRACVCNNFDQAACCMTLSVSSEFEYEYRGFDGAADCLLHRRLVLRPQAFSCHPTDITKQMDRIRRYVERGFRFIQ